MTINRKIILKKSKLEVNLTYFIMTWTLLIILIIITVIVITPLIIKAKINAALSKMEGYNGNIDKLNINLFNRNISLRNVTMRKVGSAEQDIPLLYVPIITIFFQWKALFKRIIDLKIIVDRPRLHYFEDQPAPKTGEDLNVPKEIPSLKNSIEKLTSFKVSVEVQDLEIQYVNPHTHPVWDVTVRNLNLKINDFSNRSNLSESSRIRCTFQLYEGTGEVNLIIRPLAPNLALFLDLELKSVNLVLLNDLFRVYGKVDLHTGLLDLFGEVAIKENSFKGYIKPMIRKLEFISRADRTDPIFQKIWERILAGFFTILANKHDDQVVTVIPIEGRLDDPKVNLGPAILGILQNVLIKSLTPSLKKMVNMKIVWEIARSGTKGIIRRILLPNS